MGEELLGGIKEGNSLCGGRGGSGNWRELDLIGELM